MENSVNRKKFLQISAISAILIGGGALAGKGMFNAMVSAKEYSEARLMMGTTIELKLIDKSSSAAKDASSQMYKEIARLSDVFSRFSPTSEVAILNASGRLNNASSELIEVLQKAKEFASLTDGVFDISILPAVNLMEAHFAEQRLKKSQDGSYSIVAPSQEAFASVLSLVNYQDIIIDGSSVSFAKKGMQISLDGIAKGYIVGKAMSKLNELGYTDLLVNGGGDIAVSGINKDSDDWRIGIAHPRALAGFYATASISNGAIATSGDYEIPNSYTSDNRYHHIINPKTATWSDLASASVWALDSAMADALATACMALGSEEGLKLIKSVEDAECLFIKKDMSYVKSISFPVVEII